MFSCNTMIFIVLFFIVSSTSSINAGNIRQPTTQYQRNILRNKPQSDYQGYERNTRQGHGVQSNESPMIHHQQQQQQQQQPAEYTYQYRPFESAPNHIKQLIYQSYTPQEPYVNPHAFFYNINPPTKYQTSPSKKSINLQSTATNVKPPQSTIDYHTPYKQTPPSQTIAKISKIPKQSGIKYKNNDNLPYYNSQNRNNYYSQQEQIKRSPEYNPPIATYSNHRNDDNDDDDDDDNNKEYQGGNGDMPGAIKQLLQYQAQIPYNVLANHIIFQSKKPFIPKPLSDDVIKRSGSYPNQIFYIKSNGEVFDDINNEKIYDE